MLIASQSMYDSMKLMTKDVLRTALADCGLSQKEIDFAWERKVELETKIEADMEYFKGKPEGIIEAGKIRLVPDDQWHKYDLEALAFTAKSQGQFAYAVQLSGLAMDNPFDLLARDRKQAILAAQRQKLGLETEKKNDITPVARVIGTGGGSYAVI